MSRKLVSRNLERDIDLIVPGPPDQSTGGYIYDAEMVRQLENQGWRVRVHGLPGEFPVPDDLARNALASLLESLEAGTTAIVDGLALGGLPEVVEPHRTRLRMIGLVHHPLGDETGLEQNLRRQLHESEARALKAMCGVIVTSPYTARRLTILGVNPDRIRVVEPGVQKAPMAATPSDPEARARDCDRNWQLLCVASLTPRKGQDVLVEALQTLAHRPWTCRLVGSTTRDPDFARKVAEGITESGLDERIIMTGEKPREALEEEWHRADLAILPSHFEGFGMVVTEALARGLPVITTTGGALADTLPTGAGMAVTPGSVEELAEALDDWLTRPELRDRLYRGAAGTRNGLPDWAESGRLFAGFLETLPEHPEDPREPDQTRGRQ